MANTYTLIEAQTLASTAASVTFSAIPATYTDLVIRASARGDNAGLSNGLKITLNSDTSALYSRLILSGDGSTASSSLAANDTAVFSSRTQNGDGSTASTFGSSEVYIPSYTVSQSKPISSFGAGESNTATGVFMAANANLYRSNTAISNINIAPINGSNWLTGSSFYLYGIKNS
jgi:hypothetical protein